MLAFCPKCKATVSVIFVLADNVARKQLVQDRPVEVVHYVQSKENHKWLVSKDELQEKWILARKSLRNESNV
jgi:hypothetical protein